MRCTKQIESIKVVGRDGASTPQHDNGFTGSLLIEECQSKIEQRCKMLGILRQRLLPKYDGLIKLTVRSHLLGLRCQVILPKCEEGHKHKRRHLPPSTNRTSW